MGRLRSAFAVSVSYINNNNNGEDGCILYRACLVISMAFNIMRREFIAGICFNLRF